MNLSATSFNLVNARESAALAAAAYSMDNVSFTDPFLLTHFIQDSRTDTQAILIEFHDYIALTFRGTTDRKDMFTDAEIARVKFCSGQVHEGFEFALDSIYLQIREALLELPRTKPLVIVGHSLGGALAALFALLWELETRTVAAGAMQVINCVYTFGKPRLFNHAAQFAYNTALRSRTYRVVVCDDPVPLLPGLLIGYLHEGQEVFIRDESYLEMAVGCGVEKVTLSVNPSRLWEIFWDARAIRSRIEQDDWSFLLAAEHHLEFYRAQLDRVCDAA